MGRGLSPGRPPRGPELLRGRMHQLIDEHLERLAELGQADRRNGCYRGHRLTEFGEIELAVPRTRTFSALRVVRAYARRAKDVDSPSSGFLLGLLTRNAIERRFRAVRRRARPMGTFQDKTSMARILFAVSMHENRNLGLSTPFALTQTF